MKKKKKIRTQRIGNEKTDYKRWIIGLSITAIISVIGTGLLAPYVSSYFEQVFSPKPKIQIIRENCAIFFTGENWVFVKVSIKNTGSTAEKNVKVRLQVESPWLFTINNSTWDERNFEIVPAGQAFTLAAQVLNPAVSQLQHGYFSFNVKVFGDTKFWDTADFSETW